MMSGGPTQPVIYEVNTAVWLAELSRAAGRRLTLADPAPADWDAVTPARGGNHVADGCLGA